MKVTKPFGLRLLALLAVFAMIVAACTGDSADETTTTAGGDGEPATTVDGGDGETTTTAGGDDGGEGGTLDTYTLGIFQDVTTDNPWSYLDSSGSDVWVSYVLAPTLGAPYTINYPGLEPAPDMAAGDLEPAVQDGENWVGTITLRDDLTWSDGTPFTAHDVAFTFRTIMNPDVPAIAVRSRKSDRSASGVVRGDGIARRMSRSDRMPARSPVASTTGR